MAQSGAQSRETSTQRPAADSRTLRMVTMAAHPCQLHPRLMAHYFWHVTPNCDCLHFLRGWFGNFCRGRRSWRASGNFSLCAGLFTH